jgi:hypothetical protein
MNFPCVSDQVVRTKIDKVLKVYDECVKRGKYDALNELFDITKVDGEWLSAEDRQLYYIQLESKGEVGYSSGKAASKKTIHPSKRSKLPAAELPLASTISTSDEQESSSAESEHSEYDAEEGSPPRSTRKRNKSQLATNLVTSTRVSTSQSAKICKQLSQDGVDIPTPCQSAVYKATFREATKLKEEMIEKLQTEQWSLCFDGKRIEETEYQVVVLKNERTEVKLAALRLKDGKAETIAEGIAEVLDEYNLWKSVKMFVADTTSVNTGKKNGVIVKLQEKFAKKTITKPQFIGCQHHILDRILRLVMDEELGGNTVSPNIDYPFVPNVIKNYEMLKVRLANGTEQILEKSGWRDDMKFLYHLTRVYRFFEEKKYFPLVKFQKIPNISNARWNSRAILTLLAFILIPSTRTTLKKVCRFISFDWSDYWFTNQMYNEHAFANLSNILTSYKKASSTLKNYWSIHSPEVTSVQNVL